MSELVNLSWVTQLLLIAGFVGYQFSYSGRVSLHSNFDKIFIILLFGGIGLVVISLQEQLLAALPEQFRSKLTEYEDQLTAIFAVFATMVSAIVWRRWVENWYQKLASKLSGGNTDNHPNAFQTVVHSRNYGVSQVVVTLTNGEVYESYPLGKFENYPCGPCVFGSDGSISLYVTGITDRYGRFRKVTTLSDDDGHRITYVPVSQIAEIDLRQKIMK